MEARAAAVANQTALDQAAAAEAQQQAVERINKIIELNWKTNLVLKYAQDRNLKKFGLSKSLEYVDS